MHPAITRVIDYLAANHPKPIPGFDATIRDCVKHGFSAVQIMSGLELFYGVPGRDAKRLVMAHPVYGDKREEWEQFHEELETILRNPEPQ